jgi:hypothetical protein
LKVKVRSLGVTLEQKKPAEAERKKMTASLARLKLTTRYFAIPGIRKEDVLTISTGYNTICENAGSMVYRLLVNDAASGEEPNIQSC